jgi:hypothetical protein
MTIVDWIPAITTSGLLAMALWLARNLIITRLTSSVQHEFNTKLETIRAQLRESEERLRADLRAKEAEIATLRSGAITAMASRQMAVDKRRLDAVDQLWAAVQALSPAKALTTMMGVVKFDTAAEKAKNDPRVRHVFEAMGGGFDLNKLDLSGAAKARPFVSPMAWATYSALAATVSYAVMQWQVLKSGLGADAIISHDTISKLIKAVLPHYGDFLDKFGAGGYYLVIEQLEAKLLQELQAMLAGSDADKASVERAAEILRRSQEVLAQAQTNRPAS